jgi:hypothetical protein
MFQHLFLNLLIHGEGGDGGAGAAPGAAPGAEETGVNVPIPEGKKPQNGHKAKMYGRTERLPYEYGKEPPRQNAAEPDQATNAPPADQGKPERAPFTEIEKTYREEIGQKIQAAVQDRVKNLKDGQAELNAAREELNRNNRLLSALAERQYGIKTGADGKIDYAAIEAAELDSQAEDYAVENGTSMEEAKGKLKMEAELKEKDRIIAELQKAEKERKMGQERYAKFQRNTEQANAFREKVPGFDLLAEMEKSPEFANLLDYGFPVETAYYAVHHEELMAIGQQAAAIQAQRALTASIQAGQSMPSEGGLGRAPAANHQRITDPSKWDKKMRADVRKRVQRGEEIYL